MRITATIAALAIALWVLPGCALVGGKVSQRGNDIKWKIKSKKGDRFVEAASKLKGPLDPEGPQAAGSLVYERPLYPPFRVEACLGANDDKAAAKLEDNGRFSIEMALPGARPPTEFYSSVVLRTAGGLQTFGATHLSGSAVGDEFFAGANLLYVAIDHSGSIVTFQARASESAPWTLVGEVAAAGQTFPVYPTLGVFQVTKPGKVVFDDLRVVQTAAVCVGGFEHALHETFLAGDDGLSALYRLEKDAPDRAQARVEIAAAIEHIENAAAQVETAIPTKRKPPEARALGMLGGGKRAREKARSKLDGGKPPKAVNKQVEKSLKLIFKAGELLQGLASS